MQISAFLAKRFLREDFIMFSPYLPYLHIVAKLYPRGSWFKQARIYTTWRCFHKSINVVFYDFFLKCQQIFNNLALWTWITYDYWVVLALCLHGIIMVCLYLILMLTVLKIWNIISKITWEPFLWINRNIISKII